MCKYRYGHNKCAHPKNIALECVGEEDCQFRDETAIKKESSDETQKRLGLGEERDTPALEAAEECDRCPMTECGVYCQKYNRFYCAGEENCETEEEYLEHMKEFRGLDSEEDLDGKLE